MTAVFLRPFAAVLEDAGAGILLEALSTLGCEYQVETQRLARSLRWTRAKPDSCPRTVSVLVCNRVRFWPECFMCEASHTLHILQIGKLGRKNTEWVGPKLLCW